MVFQLPNQTGRTTPGQSNVPQFGGGFSGGVDLETPEGLLELARMQGGSIGQVAEEMADPTRGILSTIGNGFKNAFKGFVDVISVPGQIVAGAISSEYTMGQAIKENINPSDIIFGTETDPTASLMKKTGSFVTRLAVDVLLDPLTYVTFGVGSGIKQTLYLTDDLVKLGKFGSKQVGDKVALSSEGIELYNKAVNSQLEGLKATALKNSAAKELEGEALDTFLNKTINANLNTDMIKQGMSRLIAKNPALVETMLDKGGIKVFGQSILSGYRVSKAIQAIPGMTIADHLTQPLRNTFYSLFNNQYTITGRIPDEVFDTMQKWKDIGESVKSDMLTNVTTLWKNFKITQQEDEFIRASVELGQIPTDPKNAEVWAKIRYGDDYTTGMDLSVRPELDDAYKAYKGMTKKNIKELWGAGIRVSNMDNYVPHFLLDEKVKTIPFSLPPSYVAKASKQANIAKFIPKATDQTGTLGQFEKPLIGDMDKLGLTKDEASGKITDISGREFERVRASVEDARTIGIEFDPGAISTAIKGSLDVIKATTLKHMITDVASKAGIPESLARPGWVPVTIKGLKDERIDFGKFVTTAKGEQLYFHPETAKRLSEFFGSVINDEATNTLLKQYDKVQNIWKAGVTSIFPAFHGRNAISNVFLNYLDIGREALNPTNHVFSAKLMNSNRKVNNLIGKIGSGKATPAELDEYHNLMTEIVLTDKTGFKWSYGELREALKRNNVAFNRNITNAADVNKTESSIFEDLFPKKTVKRAVGKTVAAPFKFGQEVIGTGLEEYSRIINFTSNLRKTGDPALSAQRTKQFLFDYSNLTKFEKTFLRRVIPFYTFTRKNLELQIKTLTTSPGRTSQQLSAIRTLGDVMAGDKLSEEEYNVLPDWIKGGTNILRSKQGSTISLIGSLGTPIEQPFQQFQTGQMLGSVSPLLRVPVELMSGYSFFHGKGLSDVTNAAGYKNAPEAVKKLIGFQEVKGKRPDGSSFTWYVSLRPEMMHLIGNTPVTGRVLSSIKQMQNEDVSGQDRLLQQIIGLRPYSFDLEQESFKKAREEKKQLEELLKRAGVIAEFKKTFIPKE